MSETMPLAAVLEALDARVPKAAGEPRAVFVPGRIEVLGKHTDYAGGRSLVAAVEQGMCVGYRPRSDRLLRVFDLGRGVETELEISARLGPAPGWSNYPVTVARRLASNFPGGLRGAEVVLSSDLPRAAGMSSSSALVVAIYLVLADVNALAERSEHRAAISGPEGLGEYLGAVENGLDFGSLRGEAGVGTFGGSEDHTAILCSRAGSVRQYSYCPVRLEREIPVAPELAFAVAVSGVRAPKTGAAKESYNRASRLASEAAAAWRQATGGAEPHLAAVLANGAAARRELAAVLAAWEGGEFTGAELTRRVEHFALESEEIVTGAGEALAAGDVASFGEWVDRSQRAAERLLDNQISETAHLARSARGLGALAASAFGAGFGGSVWALVEKERMAGFLEAWAEGYVAAFPSRRQARFLSSQPAAAARRLDSDGAAAR